jgi:outer membrane protein assembly factor BamA
VLFADLASRQLRVGIDASHADSPKVDYYGPGPGSSKGNRTNYRREDTTLDFHVAWHPVRRHVTAKFEIGPYFANVGPGKDSRFASAETVYTPREAPGIDLQTNFLRTANSVDLDFRDLPGDPHDGSRLVIRYLHYADLRDGPYSFSRVSVAGEHYIGFLNKKRTFGFRAATDLTFPGPNEVVPFYLQPTLGGPDDLRGFRLYRFNGDNLVLFNGEYRWEISTGFDTALFADAGKVFDRAHQISLSSLETSGGFGFRFKIRDKVVMRIDTGFSREGFQTWVRFNTGL